MRKVIITLIALVLIFGLISCDSHEPNVGTKNSEDIYIWTDEETGVQYVVYSFIVVNGGGAGGITPRLNADGTLYTEEGKWKLSE
jgi:hypothetical protein